jgi:hypothetical protein
MEDARLEPNMAMGGFDLHALSWKGPTGASIFMPIEPPVFQTIAPGEVMPNAPMMTLSPRTAQILFDALYKNGFRPSSGESIETHKLELEAVRAHLADMRKLAFHAVESNGPDTPLRLDLEQMVI